MSQPRFTFCIPNLNKIEFLPACIESMLAQDCPDWKCVFVDGYSTDGCWEYMQQFADDPRFLLLRGLKQGMYADWNECLRHVDTEYFYILTSDDTCDSQLTSSVIGSLDQYKHIDACHFKFNFINEVGDCILTYDDFVREQTRLYPKYIDTPHIRSGSLEVSLQFLFRTYVSITSMAFRHTIIRRLHGFSREFGSVGDIDWTVRLGFETDILYIPRTLATWRICEGQATQSSVDASEHLKKIAEANLFPRIEETRRLGKGKRNGYGEAVRCCEKMYAHSLYRRFLHQRRFDQKLRDALICFSHYPFYCIWYFSSRFTSFFKRENYFLTYRNKLARKIVEQNQDFWPPEIVFL